MLLRLRRKEKTLRSTRLVATHFLAAALVLGARTSHGDVTATECIARSESAIQLREEHRLREASAQLALCAAPRCPALIRTECEKNLSQVTAAIPTVVFEARDRDGNDLVEVSVSVDGRPLLDHLDGAAVPLDPGARTFRFEWKGQAAVEKTLVLAEAEKERHFKIVLGNPATTDTTDAPAPSSQALPSPQPVSLPPAPPQEPSRERGEQPTASALPVALMVAGGAVLGLGAVFTVLAQGKRADGDKLCPGGMCPDPDAAQVSSLSNSATSFGEAALASYLVGGLATASGITLLLLHRHHASKGETRAVVLPTLGPGTAGIAGVF
jgi:hypothetical protein